MNETLSSRFQKNNGAAIEVDGRAVRPLIEIEVVEDEKSFLVRRKVAKAWPIQGIRIKAKKGEIEVNGQLHSEIILWADTSPDSVEITVRSKSGCQLKIWNVWRMDEIVQAWVGNSGVATSESGGEMLLECSDGTGEVDFSSIVVGFEAI